jgi:2-methylisocitrate lyase-like PEP mutase family enzyme
VAALDQACERLRSLHVPGTPLVLPNAWDAATARTVASAGFPVVATTSAGVAATLGYEDHEGAPADEMLAAAARIVEAVDVPVTVDAEAGYAMEPAELVAALEQVGAAGCNLEDTDHSDESLRDPARHAEWLRAVRDAASGRGYELVINARIDVFLARLGEGPQAAIVPEALERARAYVAAGVDCVYPIALFERDALTAFIADAGVPVNALASPRAPEVVDLARLGVARISWGGLLYHAAMEGFAEAIQPLTTPIGRS